MPHLGRVKSGTCGGDFHVTAVTRLKDHPEFGPRYRVTGTIDKCRVVWWTGEGCWVYPGDHVTVTYRVKHHGEFDGEPVTTVSHVSRPKRRPDAAA